MKNIPYLTTFPRSGSHYFDELIYKETGLHIEKSHSITSLFDKNNNKQRTLITIVRDPKDSLLSYVANMAHNSYGPPSPWSEEVKKINILITEYIIMNNFLYEHADYIIDFNDLISSPDAVTKKMLELLDINKKDYSLFDKGIYKYAKQYVPSSKVLRVYNPNILDSFNIDMCYFYYNQMLEKKIIV